MPDFSLKFPIGEVGTYADRYSYEDDSAVLAIGRAARERGFYIYDELVEVCRWKTPRSGPLVKSNGAEEVEAATRVALYPESAERERMEALRSLRGVEWPTASVLLHLAYPERWPILDKRALHALGVKPPAAYSFKFWHEYVAAYQRLVAQADVDGRSFDRAMWQWSAEQGELLY